MRIAAIISLIVILSGLSCRSWAQSEPINTDRPDQSDGVYTLPKNGLQVENGLTLSREVVINNLMLRYGLTPTTEVRLLLDAGKEAHITGMKPLTISVKQRLFAQNKIIPAITLVGYGSFGQLASRGFQESCVSTEFKLAFENELSDRFAIGYNMGTSRNFKYLTLSTGLGFNATKRISTFVEYFSTIGASEQEHNLDTGILLLVNRALQVDFAFGHGIFSKDPRIFTTIGVSYRFFQPKE